MPIRVASYNIHAAIGTDGQFNPQRIIEVIKQLDADIVALQEVEHHDWRDTDLLEYIARECDYQAIAGPTMRRETRHYGNALLTRLPVTAIKHHDLSYRRNEPRGAIQVSISSDETTFQVFATHLGLKHAERRQQINQLLTAINKLSSDHTLLLGDLNDWWPFSQLNQQLHQFFIKPKAVRSYPSRLPLLALDRILVGSAWRYLNLASHDTPLAKQASDHLPVIALIESDKSFVSRSR